MRTIKIKRIVPIYNTTIYIIIGHDIKKELLKYDPKIKLDKNISLITCNGCVHKKSTNEHAIFFRYSHKPYIDTVSHEVFHLTLKILDEHNCRIQPNDFNEHTAYLHGYLMKLVFDILVKKDRIRLVK